MGAEIHGGHENNEEYFNRVYNETCRSVSRFVVSKCGNMEDAEDIIQNVYTRFFKRISEKGHEDIESPEAFLINIAKFECRTYFSGSFLLFRLYRRRNGRYRAGDVQASAKT